MHDELVPAKTLVDCLKVGHTLKDFLDGFSSVSRSQAVAGRLAPLSRVLPKVWHDGMVMRDKAEADIERTFRDLVEEWREATGVTSSLTDMVLHPAYQKIIGMGPVVVPLVLRELRERPAPWFWALSSITREDPVSPEDAGRLEKMTQAWLEWGRQRDYL